MLVWGVFYMSKVTAVSSHNIYKKRKMWKRYSIILALHLYYSISLSISWDIIYPTEFESFFLHNLSNSSCNLSLTRKIPDGWREYSFICSGDVLTFFNIYFIFYQPYRRFFICTRLADAGYSQYVNNSYVPTIRLPSRIYYDCGYMNKLLFDPGVMLGSKCV